MAKSYYIVVGIMLCLTLLAEFYFGTVFNESVRHPFDIPAMLFVAPGLLLNHFMSLGLSFDGPSHSAIIWISSFIYTVLIVGVVAIIDKARKHHSQHLVWKTKGVMPK